MTDRIVVDRQLQDAIKDKHFNSKMGEVVILDDDKTSNDLKNALNGNSKIIVTTIHKFSYITNSTKALKNKTFAVIIDEAHSSTSGIMMDAVTVTLSKEDSETEKTTYDILIDEIKHAGKQDNISMIAFTATPKATTIQLFGEKDGGAFSLYSMKQAIEEGYILDVLENYTTYQTYCEINKKISENPLYKEKRAKKKIVHLINTDETNLTQKLEIMLDHFTNQIRYLLDGQAKAMIVTSSREAAVKYKRIFDKLISENKYSDIQALVAFSDKIKLDDKEYTEPKMNGLPEAKLPEVFDTNEYQVLIVADKYQTGFDQKKLVAMYVDKKLSGITAVQTLSRLNRTCQGKETTFILDFKNKYEDIIKAFEPYYETTILANRLNQNDIYNLNRKIDDYNFLNNEDIEKFIQIIVKEKLNDRDKEKVIALVSKASSLIKEGRTETEIFEIKNSIKSFIRLYNFIIQATDFEDINLHKKYKFLRYVLKDLTSVNPVNPINLKDKISINNFVQKKKQEITKTQIKAKPEINLPKSDPPVFVPEAEEELSKIIEDLNKKYDKNFENDMSVKALLLIKEKLLKDNHLKKVAKANSQQNFNLRLEEDFSKLLVSVLDSNKDLYMTILKDKEGQKLLIKILSDMVYNKLRDEN